MGETPSDTRTNDPNTTPSTWKADFLASIVVFLVALPLCMGIAIASGVPVGAGLITGIVGGLVVGFLAGSPMQVSGPAAGLTVIVIGIVQDETLGLPMLGLVVLGAGLLQVTAGLLKLGQWFRAISPTVVAAMLAGIGVIIFSSQFHVMFDATPAKSVLQNLLSIPGAIINGVVPTEGSYQHQAAWIGILTIGSLIAWDAFKPEKLKVVPGPLAGVIVGVTVAYAFNFDKILYVELPESLTDAIMWPAVGDYSFLTQSTYWQSVFAVAIVASAETLLCATAVDQLHSGERTKYDKELTAQGVGNTLCGLFGALPMTGVIVRSSANVEAGAKTRKSAILHGVWLLALIGAAPFVLTMIPKASLAAILVYTGYRLVNWRTVLKLRNFGKSEVAIYFATVFMIVASDLLVGVIVGCVLSVFKLHYKFSHLEVKVSPPADDGFESIRILGAATFLRLPFLAQELEALPKQKRYKVSLEGLDYIDHACLELVASWEKQVLDSGGTVSIEWSDLLHHYHYEEKKGRKPSRKLSRSLLSADH